MLFGIPCVVVFQGSLDESIVSAMRRHDVGNEQILVFACMMNKVEHKYVKKLLDLEWTHTCLNTDKNLVQIKVMLFQHSCIILLYLSIDNMAEGLQ